MQGFLDQNTRVEASDGKIRGILSRLDAESETRQGMHDGAACRTGPYSETQLPMSYLLPKPQICGVSGASDLLHADSSQQCAAEPSFFASPSVLDSLRNSGSLDAKCIRQ